MVNLSPTRTPRSFSAELLSSRATPTFTGAWAYSTLDQDATLALVEVHQVSLCPTL